MTSTTTTLNGNRLIFFSPTHTSAQIARAIGEGIGMGRRMETDLTLDESSSPIEMEGELFVIVTPVYGGRVPALALQRLQRLKGNGAPAILVVVYGNRDYEDALLELRDTAISLGFMPLTAGAFIGEHSYSTPELPIAAGRPDTDDLQQAREFGKTSLEKWNRLHTTDTPIPELAVKGNFPYKPWTPGAPACPTCTESCFACGECIEVCPTHAIQFNADQTGIETDIHRCIKCCACVKYCPNEARKFSTPFAAILHEKCSTRRQPELFF